MDRTTRYRIRVHLEGELDPTWSAVLAGLAVTVGSDGTTVVGGELPDQSAVHGLLAAIRDLGFSFISIEAVVIPRSPIGLGG